MLKCKQKRKMKSLMYKNVYIIWCFPVVTLSQPDPKQQTSVYSQQPSGYPQQPIGYPQQPLGYPQQPIGYQHQPTGYQQQQTGFSQQQTGYPQLPIIYNDQVADADLEVSNAFSPPHPGSGRSVAKPTAQYSTTLNGKIYFKVDNRENLSTK